MLTFKKIFFMNIFQYFIIFVAIGSIFCITNNGTSDADFIPTNEWQVVKTGQKIPPGLHIRSDFKTGITEAKFMDKDDTSSGNTAITISNISNTEVNDTNELYSPEQIKRMLKGIKDESPTNKENVEINGTKFRSYEELKKDFETMQMSIKTDLEIIRELLDELKSKIDNARIKTILTDLEYYLHQIDNAQNFADMGGLEFLYRFIDSSDADIRSEALRCLSSAVQGNSKVKIAALKNGILSRLLILLKSSTDITTINQIFVVVSAVTRQFPIAQLAFINGGGLQISGEIFDRFSGTDDEKINIRLVTMLSDWLKERNMEEINESSSDKDKEIYAEKEKQYKKVDLHSTLIESAWCRRFASIWSTRSDRNVDYLEKLIISVNVVYPLFVPQFDRTSVTAFLADAHRTLAGLAEQETDDFYYRDMVGLVADTMSLVTGPDQRHGEL